MQVVWEAEGENKKTSVVYPALYLAFDHSDLPRQRVYVTLVPLFMG